MIQFPSGLYFLRECRKTANYLILSSDPKVAALLGREEYGYTPSCAYPDCLLCLGK